MYHIIKEVSVCEWIGDDEGCKHPVIRGKSYCRNHQDRVYLKLLPEMADYIIDKEVELEFKSKKSA